MQNKLAPSILSADFWRLGEQIKTVEESGVTMLHFDVMDGHFVPPITFGEPVLSSIRKKSDLFMDVHLMVENPDAMIPAFKEAGADGISVHAEACSNIYRTVNMIHDLGMKSCVALNPGTPISYLENILTDVDMILLMTVNPGFGGQKLIPVVMDKIRTLRALLDEKGLDTDIQVDGGVKVDNAADIIKAGANVLVAGSAVFNGDMTANLEALNKVVRETVRE